MNKENIIQSAFSKLEPDSALRDKIFERIEENEMKKQPRRHMRIAAAVAAAAAVTVIGVGSVFAAGNIISYFQSNDAVDITDMESLALYNDEVGATVSKFGYTLTLDNLATDDNFMHVFYTLKKDGAAMSEEEYYNLWFICRINGKMANTGNHNKEEAYYSTEDGCYKGVLKLNVADMDVPDTFTLEMYSEPNILKSESEFEGGYLYKDELSLTDEDKSKLLYVSTIAKKNSIKAKSVVKNVSKTFPLTYYDEIGNEKHGEGEIAKVVFSPFASQIVVKDKCEGYGGMKIAGCALFDENGQSLDILNSGLSGGSSDGGEVSNTLEFLKADTNTKSLKIVPIKGACDYNENETATQQIGTYPLTYKVNRYGNIVVTDIRFADGIIEIDYYKDGFSLFDPYFKVMDKDGNDVQPGGKLGCLQKTIVHHNTNSYTVKYSYCDEYDEHGRRIPFDVSSVSKEKLEKAFTHLSIGAYDFELDYDNAIDIDLK